MMSPEAEREVLEAAREEIEAEAQRAYETMLRRIRTGLDPREAVRLSMQTFSGRYADALAERFSEILSTAVGSKSVLEMAVGPVTLSRKLYRLTEEVAANVGGIVERHARGFQDARRLSLELFEGYGFRLESDEPLAINWRNPALPKYLRDELLRDPGLQGKLARHFARINAAGLKTPALRASYLEYLEVLEDGDGFDLLGTKLNTAMQEKVRYFANRIAQTELHRAFAHRQAQEVLDDTGVEFVQYRLSPTHPEVDVCDYFARLNAYGLGPGVYPKGRAPVAPLHPHCRCYLKPRTDIKLGTKGIEDADAGRKLLASIYGNDPTWVERVMGSKARAAAAVESGADPWDLLNAALGPDYPIRSVFDTVDYLVALARRSVAGSGLAVPEALSQYWDPSTPAGRWHEAAFRDSDERIRRLVGSAGSPTAVLETPKKHAYARWNAEIEMDSHRLETAYGQSVWRHEFGHHIDGYYGRKAGGLYWTDSGPFPDALSGDSRELVRLAARGNVYAKSTVERLMYLTERYEGALSELRRSADRSSWLSDRYAALGLDYSDVERLAVRHADFATDLVGFERDARFARIAAALEERDIEGFMRAIAGETRTERRLSWEKGSLGSFSDLFGSMTKNKAVGYQDGWYGHTTAYYKQAPTRNAREAFANLTDLYGDVDAATWEKIIDRFAPRTSAAYRSFLDATN